MTKKTFLGAMAVVMAVALTGTALVASNMGFKLNYQLLQPSPGVSSNSGTNVLALPDFKQAGMVNAIDLMNDIGFSSTTNVQKFLTTLDTLTTYTGRKGTAAGFSLDAGQAYYVRMTTSVNYIVVGSDDPALSYTLFHPTGNPGTSNSGTNFYAYNYHQTATDAIGLMNDIGFASVTNIQKFLTLTDTLTTYTGRKGTAAGFALKPGEGYYVRIGAATDIPYTPSHY